MLSSGIFSGCCLRQNALPAFPSSPRPAVGTAVYDLYCSLAWYLHTVPLGTFTLNAWFEITNLFKRRNLVGIQDIHWSWFDWNTDGPGEGIEYPGGPLDDPYVYSIPRMICFGLGLNW